MAEQPSRRSRTGGRARTSEGGGAVGSARSDAHPDLDLDENRGAQYRIWTFERIGWGLVALLLLAAVLGLFGRGPLSRTYQVNRQAPMALEYDRFGRQSSESQMFIHLLPGSARGGQAKVWIDRGLVDGITELHFTPMPVEAAAAAGRVVYRFAVPEPGSPALIDVQYKPEDPGLLSGRIGLEGRPPILFRQFVYP